MTTRLSDLVIPEIFDPIALKESKYRSAFFQTGVMVQNPMAQQFASSNYGQKFHMPFYNDLAEPRADEANVSSDDPAELATPDTLSETDQVTVKNMRNKGWSKANLTTALNARDPIQVAASRAGAYWARQIDETAIAYAEGVRADNAASDGGDMIYDAWSATPDGSNTISAENVIRAKDTAGDASAEMTVIAMHSKQYHRLLILDLIDFIPDSQGAMTIATYMGMRVIVSDQCYIDTVSNPDKYWSYIMAPGLFMYGEGAPDTPVETQRHAEQGNGEGVEELWTRRHWIAHIDGFTQAAFTVTSGKSPTWTELRSAANIARVVADRRQVPLAFLGSNGLL